MSRFRAERSLSRHKGRSHIVRRPFVTATFAMTLDGKITTHNFAPVDFTSREDKMHLWRQRALADAVLVGHTTIERDNVRLGLPAELRALRIKSRKSPSPIRVIVSNEGKIDPRLKIFQSNSEQAAPVLIFSTSRMPKTLRARLSNRAELHLSKGKNVDLAGMLQTLRRDYKVRRLACEGGPTLFRAMLEQGLIDQLNLTVAPFLFGGAEAPTLTGLDKKFLPRSVQFRLVGMRIVADECFLTYKIKTAR